MKILLAGYYGFDNIGDELLGETARSLLEPICNEIKTLDRANRQPKKLIFLIKHCDILIFGGGSLFQDVTGRGLTVLYYSLVFLLAKYFRKKVFFIAQGIGPVKRPINYWLVKQCLRQTDYLTVRNKESAAFLMALGVQKFKMYNDLLFAYKVPTVPVKKDPKKISVVFSFKSLANDYRPQLFRLMQRIRGVIKHIEITIVSMQKNVDEAVVKDLEKIGGIKVLSHDKQEIFKAIAQADLAVGMRMHFLILAAKYNIPFIGLVYDPKIIGICKTLNMPYIYLTELDTLGTVLLNELAKVDMRKTQLRVDLQREETIANQAVAELLSEVKNAVG